MLLFTGADQKLERKVPILERPQPYRNHKILEDKSAAIDSIRTHNRPHFCTSPNHTEEIFLSTFHTLCRPTISPYETGADNLVDRRQRSRITAINGIGKSPSHVRISTSVQHVGLQRQGPRCAQARSPRTSHAAAFLLKAWP